MILCGENETRKSCFVFSLNRKNLYLKFSERNKRNHAFFSRGFNQSDLSGVIL